MDSKKDPNKRLFIGSLPYRFTEGELLDLFVPFGKIISLKIIRNRWGKSRGIGFVEFETLSEAITAKQKMHRHKLGELAIIVDYAQPDPFLTPEGQANYIAGQLRHPQKQIIPSASIRQEKVKKNFYNEEKIKKNNFRKNFEHQRQSVFNSRVHHARVGAKFASRNKNK